MEDFARLLWDVECGRVVMLTNTVEAGKVSTALLLLLLALFLLLPLLLLLLLVV